MANSRAGRAEVDGVGTARATVRSTADVAGPFDEVCVAGQLAQAARTAGVQFVGTDANLGPQAEFAAIVEPGAGIHHDRRRIDRQQELPSRPEIAGDDRIGVVRAKCVNVPDRHRQIVDHPNREDQFEILGVVVGVGGGATAGQQRPGGRTTPQFDPRSLQLGGRLGQECRGNLAMDQQGFGRVADSRPAIARSAERST